MMGGIYFKIFVVCLSIFDCYSNPIPEKVLGKAMSGTASLGVIQKSVNLFKTAGPGPLGYNVLNKNRELKFIGSINGKHFYIERSKKTWTSAEAGCTSNGMRMGRFNSDSEKNFVYGKLPSSDGDVWIGGKTEYSLVWPHLLWSHTGDTVPQPKKYYFMNDVHNALALDASVGEFGNTVGIHRQSDKLYYLCYL